MYTVYQKTQSMKTKLMTKIAKYHEAKKQRGMTLLEIIIVLGIIGTIAAGVVVLAQRAFDSRAISEVVNNTNTLRIATKDAYQRAAGYPVSKGGSSTYTTASIKDTTKSTEIVARLVQLGKVSTDEALNGISNNFINIGGAKTVGTQAVTGLKGFVMEINGLNEAQCRSIVSQVGNQWDYVQVSTAGTGTSAIKAEVDMSVIPAAGILRTLNAKGNVDITPDLTATVCKDSPDNAVILGSR